MSQLQTATRIDRIRAMSGGELADIRTIHPGDTAACETTITVADVITFARLSGDDNPLHLDPSTSARYGFEAPVAHGLLSLALISRLIGTQLPGRGSLWVGQDLKFPTPVMVGDQVAASVTVEQVSIATGLVVLRTEAINVRTGKPVVSGLARVRVMAPQEEQGPQ